LNLHIAHQNFDQIDPNVLSAIFKNTGTLAAFRVNFEDADRLSSSFRPIQAGELSSSGIGDFWCQASNVVRKISGFSPDEQAFVDRGSLGRVRSTSRRLHAKPRQKLEAEFAIWWS